MGQRELPPMIGRDLRTLTEEEVEQIIAWQSSWPMSRIRKHQSLVEKQLQWAAAGKFKADEVSTSNLQIRQRLLDVAVLRKVFRV